MKLNLDFALYKGKTRLRDWWKQVKAHFIEVQNAINELDTDITNEAATRDRVDTAIMQNLTDEINARIAGDTSEAAERKRVDSVLLDNITDAAAAIAAETSARQTADNNLDGKITTEAAARHNADNELRGNLVDIAASLTAETAAREEAETKINDEIKILKSTAHTHDNKEILDAIDAERVEKWDSIESQVTQEQLDAAFEHLYEIAIGHDLELEKVYYAIGLTVYDGGLIGAPISGVLDCGEIDDEITKIIDCGGPEPYIAEIAASSSTIDGGTLDTPSDGLKMLDGGELQ